MTSTYSSANAPERAMQDAAMGAHQYEQMMFALSRRVERAARDHGQRLQKFWTDAAEVQRRFAETQKEGTLADDAKVYSTDMQQRLAMTLDVLRERGQQRHRARGGRHAAGADLRLRGRSSTGKTLPRPVNYMLLQDPAARRRRGDATGSGPT